MPGRPRHTERPGPRRHHAILPKLSTYATLSSGGPSNPCACVPPAGARDDDPGASPSTSKCWLIFIKRKKNAHRLTSKCAWTMVTSKCWLAFRSLVMVWFGQKRKDPHPRTGTEPISGGDGGHSSVVRRTGQDGHCCHVRGPSTAQLNSSSSPPRAHQMPGGWLPFRPSTTALHPPPAPPFALPDS